MDNIELLEQQAIDAAISKQWDEAVKLNKNIIQIDNKNIDAYLRLGFANLQLGKIDLAEKFYKKSLKIQSSNNVAKENLERIKVLKKKSNKKNTDDEISFNPSLFLETPGKTKSFTLVNLGQKNTLANLTIGQELYILVKKRRIEFRNKAKDYIGLLPDDISKRLAIFIAAGSEFKAHIKEANLNKVVVFLREEKKGKKVQRFSSFPQNLQANLNEMTNDEDPDEDDFSNDDLEKLAENLPAEEKEYLPYAPEDEEDDVEE